MKSKGRTLWTLMVIVVAVAASVLACSKNNPSNSTPGGLELDSGNIPSGGVFQHTFANAGAYPYHCAIHAAMTGNSVTVDVTSTTDSAFVQIVSMSTPGFSPSTVTIKPGGHVRWLNVQGTTHTVTTGS